jgi:1,4-dihydroxy-2-naphthoate octaprenyltransferase
VLVGAAATYWDYDRLEPLALLLALAGALLAHISVNVLNDVEDFFSGIDLHTQPTPFSGGSGFLVRGELTPEAARRLGLGALAGTIPIGFFFLLRHGWAIVPLGLVGVVLVLFYTRRITRNPWICLVAPGLGFGPVMVLGVYFCLTGHYGSTALAASVVPGFLVSNLLLLNQFPDIEADARGGRRHIPLSWGRKKAAKLYAALTAASYGWITLSVSADLLPWGAALGWMTLPLAWRVASGVLLHFDDRQRLIPLMGLNVAVTLLTPSLLSLGMILQGIIL